MTPIDWEKEYERLRSECLEVLKPFAKVQENHEFYFIDARVGMVDFLRVNDLYKKLAAEVLKRV